MDPILVRLQTILQPFKNSENPQAVQFIKGDETALKVLSAWPSLPLVIKEPMVMGTVPQHRGNIWKYAWRFRKIDYRTLEEMTGLDKSLLQEKVGSLVAHLIIYPDGSICRAAEALLQGR